MLVFNFLQNMNGYSIKSAQPPFARSPTHSLGPTKRSSCVLPPPQQIVPGNQPFQESYLKCVFCDFEFVKQHVPFECSILQACTIAIVHVVS